jgi:hypothetical protein
LERLELTVFWDKLHDIQIFRGVEGDTDMQVAYEVCVAEQASDLAIEIVDRATVADDEPCLSHEDGASSVEDLHGYSQ